MPDAFKPWKKKRPLRKSTVYVSNRLTELKWANSGWVIPPETYEEDIASLVNNAFGALKMALNEDDIRVRKPLERLLEHQRVRISNVVCAEIKRFAPSPKTRAGMSAGAAQMRISAVVKTLFRGLHTALRESRVIESSAQALVILLLTITEEQIADGLSEYMGEWR